MDESVIRARCAEIRSDFLNRWPGTAASYASKAFLTPAMARIVDQEGLGLDVVSGGELRVAAAAGFPPGRIEMHGTAKTEKELREAIERGVGRVVVDGPMELEFLGELAAASGKRPDILLRVAPGVSPHTHAHIVTGQAGGKFGLPAEALHEAVRLALKSRGVRLRGFHFHIGSQIFDPAPHVEAVRRVAALAESVKKEEGFEAEELNFGGGFGVGTAPVPSPENPGTPPLPGASPTLRLRLFTDAMMEALTRECAARGLARPAAAIEPGRWVVAEAGITLYTVTTVKRLESAVYVGVDGGMPDNPRPSLYGAEYSAALADKIGVPDAETVKVAGKCCETGDILIQSAALPRVERGDILAVFNTGAYNFSMASHYTRLPRPAVVLVSGGRADIVAARWTEDDLLRGETVPERLKSPFNSPGAVL
jgi:diaminopimelate decarboxylase